MNPQPHNVPARRRGTGRGRRPSNRGVALIEAVLVMSLLLMLSLGCAEFGYAFYLKHSLLQAAAAGLRQAILAGSTDSAVRSAVANQLALTNMQNIGYTLTTVPGTVNGCNNGVPVTITLSCVWGNVGVSPLPTSLGGLGPTKPFSCSATMIHE